MSHFCTIRPIDKSAKPNEFPLETQRTMNDDLPPKGPENTPANNLPLPGKTVRVWHEGRERMAYLDSKGEWRDDLLGYVLPGQVKVLKPDEH
jgi:hypothetical protein